jgi:hypothetical protein
MSSEACRSVRAHQEHGGRRLFAAQELSDVRDALGLVQCGMEREDFDLGDLPVKPPQHILNLSACLDLATENTHSSMSHES